MIEPPNERYLHKKGARSTANLFAGRVGEVSYGQGGGQGETSIVLG